MLAQWLQQIRLYPAYRQRYSGFVAADYPLAVRCAVVTEPEKEKLIAFKRLTILCRIVLERDDSVRDLHIRYGDSARRIDRFDAVDGNIYVLRKLFEIDINDC